MSEKIEMLFLYRIIIDALQLLTVSLFSLIKALQ